MSIVVTEKSKVRSFSNDDDYIRERTGDVLIDHIDDYHVRIKKLFPMCKEKQVPKIDSYKRFHLRFYIPLGIYQDKYRKVKKCFIMFNGLDELDNFTLYDQIGKGLCKHEYAAVLLPLPDHLNRNMMYRQNDPFARKRPSTSFIDEPEKIYNAYNQLNTEVNILIQHFKGLCSHSAAKDCCAFFSHFFNDNLKISLLGFSLGGLAALSNFLIQDIDFNSCILINSGAKLDDIDVGEFQSIEKWKETVRALADVHYNMRPGSDEHKLFDMIFLGNRLSFLQDELKEKSRKILFILGGADSVTKYESIGQIEPKQHGLAILKVPGIHHFLSIDTHWDKWFPLVNETIRAFDESASNESLLPKDILGSLAYFQLKYNISQRIDHIDLRRVTDRYDMQSLARTLYAAKGTYGKINIALLEMYKLIHKAKKRPHLYPDYILKQYSNLIGVLAVNKFNINELQILSAMEKQINLAKSGDIVPYIGEILFEEGVLTIDQIGELLKEQEK